jgi:hypothetical protein
MAKMVPIDRPQPVDVAPLLDALKRCVGTFEWNEGTSDTRKTMRRVNADLAREIETVLEQWEADHEGN